MYGNAMAVPGRDFDTPQNGSEEKGKKPRCEADLPEAARIKYTADSVPIYPAPGYKGKTAEKITVGV